MQVLAQDLGVKSGISQRDMVQHPIAQFVLLVRVHCARSEYPPPAAASRVSTPSLPKSSYEFVQILSCIRSGAEHLRSRAIAGRQETQLLSAYPKPFDGWRFCLCSEGMVGTLLYFVLLYNVSGGHTSTVCFEDV